MLIFAYIKKRVVGTRLVGACLRLIQNACINGATPYVQDRMYLTMYACLVLAIVECDL
jgi:hypothetical protein